MAVDFLLDVEGFNPVGVESLEGGLQFFDLSFDLAFVHVSWLVVTFGMIPSGVCIIAPFTTQSTLIVALFTISFPINNPTSAAPTPPSPTACT